MYEVGEAGPAAVLLSRAASGDEQAWRELVDLYTPVIWGVSRAFAGNTADAEDVCQATWLSLAENLDRLREPEKLPGWLVTTARREAIRLRRARSREAPIGLDTDHLDGSERSEPAENLVMRMVSASRLAQAFGGLPQRCQQLLRVLAVTPEASYAQVSEALGIPRGTIGPKKSRCLAELRKRLLGAELPEEVAG
ncbi:sigma-70 family RNA polymerase sigma factor [Saccharopolyspora sp. TS4A08]|uniref:Sigma-70 family RNA polymerase sigma factor n=1 Tax=Saccharopolyspora ipomoeae TaxID=3042027 RepID=A0ABT6PT45_9PSEU|nr:sigma-70 family RNA polymerase sigma factor [Saccharopolyspora sp. TS4A08]MDI2031161.1 sigma-70 family RNA polymerase sigma factor [Saccharopolyspora sp. TS4A08]